MGARILIVDDERNIRLMLRTTLSSEGYEISEAASGWTQALTGGWFAELSPDIGDCRSEHAGNGWHGGCWPSSNSFLRSSSRRVNLC